jgi:hypothetical protein
VELNTAKEQLKTMQGELSTAQQQQRQQQTLVSTLQQQLTDQEHKTKQAEEGQQKLEKEKQQLQADKEQLTKASAAATHHTLLCCCTQHQLHAECAAVPTQAAACALQDLVQHRRSLLKTTLLKHNQGCSFFCMPTSTSPLSCNVCCFADAVDQHSPQPASHQHRCTQQGNSSSSNTISSSRGCLSRTRNPCTQQQQQQQQ